MLAIVYHVKFWQVLPQLSCGDTCEIWMWCKKSNRYLDRIENFACGEINERNFSNPHPWFTCDLIIEKSYKYATICFYFIKMILYLIETVTFWLIMHFIDYTLYTTGIIT